MASSGLGRRARMRASAALVQLGAGAQVTILEDLRSALNVEAGDYLEAGVVDGKLVLSPVTAGGRDVARGRLLRTLQGSRFVGPGPEPDDDELLREVVEVVKETRRKRRAWESCSTARR